MLGRRRVLTGMLGVGAVGLGGMPAGADAAARITRAGAIAVPATRRENCSFLNEAKAIFAHDMARGVAPAYSDRTVFCPLCQQNLTLKAPAPGPA